MYLCGFFVTLPLIEDFLTEPAGSSTRDGTGVPIYSLSVTVCWLPGTDLTVKHVQYLHIEPFTIWCTLLTSSEFFFPFSLAPSVLFQLVCLTTFNLSFSTHSPTKAMVVLTFWHDMHDMQSLDALSDIWMIFVVLCTKPSLIHILGMDHVRSVQHCTW